MKLESREWSRFNIGGKEAIFNVTGTKTTHPSKLLATGKTPRITCAATNNAVDGFYKNKQSEKGGVITVDSATIGYMSFQEYDFIATDHVEKIKQKEDKKFNRYLGLFIISCIQSAVKNKYSYGYKFSQFRIKKQKILLPINENNEPNYPFMENYSKSIFQAKEEKYVQYIKKVLEKLEYKKIVSLQEKEWREFGIEEVGEIHSGKDIYANERISGTTPYVSATAKNNGIGYYVGNDNKTLASNSLSVNRNGSVGYSFYHPYKALFSNDCRNIKLHYKSEQVGYFIANQITKQKNKYNYGYKMGTGRLKRQKILLPINDKEVPDYVYMEQYIKNIKFKKIKQYLDFKMKTDKN